MVQRCDYARAGREAARPRGREVKALSLSRYRSLVVAAFVLAATPLVAACADARPTISAQTGTMATRGSGDAALLDAARRQARNVPIEISAVVTKLLKDDTEGLRHQRFLIRAAGLSILVAHNIDIAARVPVQVGDTVRIRGEYVWNAKGGVLHWTHHDPRGKHPTGFVDVRGQHIQ
jgi:hypothetical protein